LSNDELSGGLKTFASALRIARASLLVVAMILDIVFAFQHWGAAGVVGGVVVFPATLLLLPAYAGLTAGYWLPALVTYIPQAAILILFGVIALGSRRQSN
jgi:hypothetical protein